MLRKKTLIMRDFVLIGVVFGCLIGSPSSGEDIIGESEMFYQTQTSFQLAQIYTKIEQILLTRLDDRNDSSKLKETIKALGLIRSKKAVPKLLEMIDYSSKKRILPGGQAVQLTGQTYRDTYLALGALQEIGVPLDQCISEIKNAQEGSKRETLLVRLAHAYHGETFIDRARLLEKSNTEKWKRVLKLSGER